MKKNFWKCYLKKYRADNNLTQEQLAALLDISIRNIENWEGDVTKPPAYLVLALERIAEKRE